MTALPEAYRKIVMSLIDTARGILENGEALQPFAFVGCAGSGKVLAVLIDTETIESKDRAADAIKQAAEGIGADFVFNIMEAWGLRPDKLPRYQEILDRYGSIGASPYRIDTASFVLETKFGTWAAQMPMKLKGHSKKKRTFGPVELQFMDGVEGRFADLLPGDKTDLH